MVPKWPVLRSFHGNVYLSSCVNKSHDLSYYQYPVLLHLKVFIDHKHFNAAAAQAKERRLQGSHWKFPLSPTYNLARLACCQAREIKSNQAPEGVDILEAARVVLKWGSAAAQPDSMSWDHSLTQRPITNRNQGCKLFAKALATNARTKITPNSSARIEVIECPAYVMHKVTKQDTHSFTRVHN